MLHNNSAQTVRTNRLEECYSSNNRQPYIQGKRSIHEEKCQTTRNLSHVKNVITSCIMQISDCQTIVIIANQR
jgi:hypothetical protein